MDRSINKLAMAAVLTAVMCVLAPFSIPIGPVSITLGVFCVFLTALILPGYYSLLSVLAYVGLALLGLPVCSGFAGGPAAVFGPTGGYILGYFFIAFFTSLGARSQRLPVTALCMAAGLLLCYALGTGWFMFLTGRDLAISLALCVWPFIPADLAKGACALVFQRLLKNRLVLR